MLHIETGETNEILRTKCEPVTVFDEALKTFITEMEETMLTEEPETGRMSLVFGLWSLVFGPVSQNAANGRLFRIMLNRTTND